MRFYSDDISINVSKLLILPVHTSSKGSNSEIITYQAINYEIMVQNTQKLACDLLFTLPLYPHDNCARAVNIIILYILSCTEELIRDRSLQYTTVLLSTNPHKSFFCF